MPVACFIVTFPTLKYLFFIKWFIAVLSDVVLKPSPTFAFLPKYGVPWWDNLIKVLSPTLKAKSTMDESLDFSLSRGSFI